MPRRDELTNDSMVERQWEGGIEGRYLHSGAEELKDSKHLKREGIWSGLTGKNTDVV